jgi:uncharacterized membrane protein YdbT with pleckstrin-like domain
MYCLQCGVQLLPQANFCSGCGAATQAKPQAVTNKANTKPLIEIQSVMVTWLILMRYFPLQLNLTLSGGLGFGLLAIGYHWWHGNLTHFYRPFIFFACVFFILTPLVIYIAYRKTFNATRYQFYNDRLEYYEGFWNVQHKVIYYKHITEITLYRNIIQRMYRIGSIHFTVPSMGARGRGITIPDVKNSEQLYEQVQRLVRGN